MIAMGNGDLQDCKLGLLLVVKMYIFLFPVFLGDFSVYTRSCLDAAIIRVVDVALLVILMSNVCAVSVGKRVCH